MKGRLFPLLLLLTSCNPANVFQTKEYDYDDVEAKIAWSEVFLQSEEEYSVYFYSLTCGHCKELKGDILNYCFGHYEKLYFSETDENTVFGSGSDLIGIDRIEDFFILGTPFLINVVNHMVSNYYAGNTKIREYINTKTAS